MRRKSLLVFALVVVLLGLTLNANEGHALTELDRVKREREDVERQAALQAQQQLAAERELIKLAQKREETLRDLAKIEADLEANSLAMLELQVQIIDTENDLYDATEQLEAVNKRIEERDALIRDRLRMMYKKGDVKYIEVLMQSTSFSDFLDRMHFLNLIVNQDQTILDEQKADKVVKEQKQQEVESHLASLKDLYYEHEVMQAKLTDLRHEREVQIAQIQMDEEHYEHISEEAERAVMELAARAAELQAKEEELRRKAGKLTYPLPREYRITSKFGPRTHPVTGERGKLHTGIDFGAPKGTSILAAGDGRVIAAQWANGYGNYVIIDHGDNEKGESIWTLYAHMSKITTKSGAYVEAGDKIGEVGATGTSTGHHLHFEVRKNQKAVDPAPYIFD